jgi:hypothetical protein
VINIEKDIEEKIEKAEKLIDKGEFETASCLMMEVTSLALERAGASKEAKEIRKTLEGMKACRIYRKLYPK